MSDGSSTSEDEYWPAPMDLAPYTAVEANATCGDHGPDTYCRDMPAKYVLYCERPLLQMSATSTKYEPQALVIVQIINNQCTYNKAYIASQG